MSPEERQLHIEEIKLVSEDYRYRDQLMVTEFALSMTAVGIAANLLEHAAPMHRLVILGGVLLFLNITGFHLHRINQDRLAAGKRKTFLVNALGMVLVHQGYADRRRFKKVSAPQLMVWFTWLVNLIVAIGFLMVACGWTGWRLTATTIIPATATQRDWPMFWWGFALSIVSGAIVWAAQTWLHRRSERLRYEPIAGKYMGYPLNENEVVDYSRVLSEARVVYLQANILQLTVHEREADSEWQGLIFMEGARFGTVTWQYVRRDGLEPPKGHYFGFKRCIFTYGYAKDGTKRPHLYLIGDEARGYGTEVLEQVST